MPNALVHANGTVQQRQSGGQFGERTFTEPQSQLGARPSLAESATFVDEARSHVAEITREALGSVPPSEARVVGIESVAGKLQVTSALDEQGLDMNLNTARWHAVNAFLEDLGPAHRVNAADIGASEQARGTMTLNLSSTGNGDVERLHMESSRRANALRDAEHMMQETATQSMDEVMYGVDEATFERTERGLRLVALDGDASGPSEHGSTWTSIDFRAGLIDEPHNYGFERDGDLWRKTAHI